MEYFHSVLLDRDKCHGCTNCISHCPTEAIRVKHGKAKIIKERCIDCGECIKVCQSHAKIAAADDFDALIEKYPENPSAYISYGNMYFDRQQFEKAKEYFTKAIEKDPYNYTAYNNRANTEEMLFETKNADNDRKKAESFLNPKL